MSIKGLYTAPPGCAVIKAVARSLITETNGDMNALRRCTILMPTRRAIRLLEDELLEHAAVPTVLLPKIMAIGDVELPPEDEESGRLPPRSVSGLERIASLMPYLEKHNLGGVRFEGRWRMAQEIAKLIDLLQTEALPIDAVSDLLKESDVAQQWHQYGQVFETIATDWLKNLKEHNRVNAAEGRTRRINALIDLWQETPPQDPVWLIGSTGSIPAVRHLMKFILGLPHGAVMLPGVDTRMSDPAWSALGDAHPQAILKQTITELRYDRRELLIWPDCGTDQAITDRDDWLSAALSPFPHAYAPSDTDNVSLMVAATAQEEAEGIAEYCLHHVNTTPDRSLVIVTNDNELTAKLLPILSAYNIHLDPSAGLSLRDTSFGQGLTAFLRVLSRNASFVDLWSLLKRPDFLPSWPITERADALIAIEKDYLRKPLFVPDTMDALLALLPSNRLNETRALFSGQRTLAQWAALLAQEIGHYFLIRSAVDKAAYDETINALDAMAALPLTHALDYDDAITPICDQLMRIGLRLPFQPERSVHILGTMEARLIQADTVILAGLNEGKWPDMPQPSPFLSRGMRHKLGVPDSERHAALSGHDFQQAFLMPRVVLSYALRDDSAPVLPARWLMRLRSVTAPEIWMAMEERGKVFLNRRKGRHMPNAFTPALPPAPQSNIIPSPLFVTQLEMWRNDPYSFWARHICGLKKLDPLFSDISAADKGTLWHKIFKGFAEGFQPAMDDKAARQLFDSCVKKVLDSDNVPMAKRRVWEKRLSSAADPLIGFERERRSYSQPHALETKTSGQIEAYAISAKADRIDETNDGRFMLVDYKTGAAPSGVDVENGYACQLSVLSLILKNPTNRLEYVTIKGGRDPFSITPFDWSEDEAQATKDGLINWIDMFAKDNQAFISLADLRAKSRVKAQDYLHLARHKEWGIGA